MSPAAVEFVPPGKVHRERLDVTPGRLLVAVLCVLCGLWSPIATWVATAYLKPHTWTYKDDILPLYYINTLIFLVAIAADIIVYDSFKRNWKSLMQNGFTPAGVLIHSFMIVFVGVWMIFFLVAYEVEQTVPRLPDLPLLLRVAGFLAFNDYCLFKPLHTLMHRKLPSIHLLHHCCFVSSFSTNFFTNVIDFSFNATGFPVALLVFKTDFFGQRDDFAFLVYTVIALVWYFIDHDRLVQLHHFEHHLHLDCNYFVYKPGRVPRDPEDLIRRMLVKVEDHPHRFSSAE